MRGKAQPDGCPAVELIETLVRLSLFRYTLIKGFARRFHYTRIQSSQLKPALQPHQKAHP